MRRLYLVPFGKRKTTERLLDDARKALNRNGFNDFSHIWYIAPTPRKAREATKIFTALIGKELVSFIPPRFRTLKTLAQELYSGGKILLPDYLKPAFLQGLGEKVSLSYYYHIGELIKDFKSANLFGKWEETKEAIKKELFSFPREASRMEEVFKIIERYEKSLAEKSFIDSEDLMREVAIQLKQKGKRKGVLVLDGFMDLTKLEEEFLSALILSFENIFALAYYDPKREELYSLPKEFPDFLFSVTEFEVIRDFDGLNRYGREEKDFLVFPSREEEVEGIARRIKRLFTEGKLSLAETIVTFPDLGVYAGIVERVFKKYKIPFTLYPQRSLLSSPVIIPVINLLKAIIDDYPRIPTIVCLTSPFFSRLKEKTRELVPLYSQLVGIIKGEANWRNLVRNLLKERVKSIPVSGAFVVERDINFFLSRTKNLMRENARLFLFLSLLAETLRELGWAEDLGGSEEEIPHLEDKREFLSFLRSLRALGDIECTLAEFVEIMETTLKYHPIVPESEERGVRVLGLMETRGLSAEYIFFGGLCEGSLPSPLRRDPFLPDWLRKKLGLLCLDRHTSWQRLHFFRVLTTPKEIFLSYPQQEGDRIFLPCPYLEGAGIPEKKEEAIFTEEDIERLRGKIEGVKFSPTPIDFTQEKVGRKFFNKRFRPYVPVTEIEKIRRCPYLFYLENILGLTMKKEVRFEIEPLQWGELVHSVLERLYYEEGRVFPVSLEEIPERVEKILSSLLAVDSFPPFWRDVARKIFEKTLPDFIESERQLRNLGFYPFKIEEEVKDVLLPGIEIYGKIDRIDRRGDDYLIIDYKTGVMDVFPRDIEKGSHLQLPLYSYLLRRKGFRVFSFGIYSFKEARLKFLAEGEEDCQEKEEKAVGFAKEALLMVLEGNFPPNPVDEGFCRFCSYPFLCPKIAE